MKLVERKHPYPLSVWENFPIFAMRPIPGVRSHLGEQAPTLSVTRERIEKLNPDRTAPTVIGTEIILVKIEVPAI